MVGELCYIGSTKDIRRRIRNHKSTCYSKNSKDYNIKLYKTIRDVYGTNWDNVKWSVVDCYYNVDKTFRKTIEQYYIELFKSQLNMVGAILNKEKRKKRIKEYKSQYRIKNRDIINEKQNQKITCVCGSTYTKHNKKRHEKSQKHKNYLLTIVK